MRAGGILTLRPYNDTAVDGLSLYGFSETPGGQVVAAFAISTRLPADSTLSQSWQQGILLFSDSPLPPPGPDVDLADRVLPLLNDLQFQVGVVWLGDAAGGSPAPSVKVSLPLHVVEGGVTVSQFTTIPFGHCELGIAAGTPVEFDLVNKQLTFSNLSLTAPTLFFATAPAGRKFATIGPSSVSDSYTLANTGVALSLGGATSGCWRFQLTLEKDTGRNLKSDMELFDAGLRYFKGGAGEAFYYPVFDTDGGSLTLYATLDPLQVLNAARSFFSFGEDAPPLASYLRTTGGGTVFLQPADDAVLIFAPRPQGTYLVPSGGFTLGSAGQPAARMLCGTTGTEYLEIPAGSTLYFLPGQSANIDDLLMTHGPPAPGTTTAWVSIVPPAAGGPVNYYYQSPKLLYYQVGAPQTPWSVLEPVLAQLTPTRPPVVSDYYPLVPYAGVRQRTDSATLMGPDGLGLDPSLYDAYQACESVLFGARSQLITQGGQPPAVQATPSAPAIYGATAQGLLVGFDQTMTQWETLTLAQGESEQALMLEQITGDFQAALQGQQVFIVMTESVNSITPPCFTAPASLPVEFAGWTFEFAPQQWATQGTIAILKYYDGLDLVTLVGNTADWSWPEAAGADIGATQAALQNIFAEVESSSQTDPNYVYLYEQVLSNPDWQGLLFFNVPMDVTTFPPELAMLSAGINPSGFFAQHVGVSLTSVVGLSDATQPPEVKPSSAFGLIDYNDPTPLDVIGSYGYKVSSLEVLILNSVSVNVQATVLLAVNQLFGHQTTSSAPGNVIELTGSAQAHDGQINLMLQSTGQEVFILQDSVIKQVAVETVQFFSLNTPDTSDPDADPTVYTQFLFSGYLSFLNLADAQESTAAGFKPELFDFFSFDQLAYQQLQLNMQYPFQSPTQTSFTFNPDFMTFSLSESEARAQSLVSQLSLGVQTFASALLGAAPSNLNYISVSVVPFNNSSGLNSSWYGLVCALSLGSAGALAAQQTLELSMLLAWSPVGGGQSPDSMWFGVAIPGANSSGVFFSLEDVIQLSVGQILLTAGAANAPVLTFENIGLTVLGQTIPPGGQTSAAVFGDPAGQSNALAWFASYLKGK